MVFKKISIIFPVIIFLSFFLFNFSFAQREVEVPFPGLATTTPALPEYIEAIYKFALIISGVIVFGALVYGGFLYLTSAGNPARINDAKDQIFSAILGLIILFSAYLILRTINPELIMLSQPGVQRCKTKENCPEGQECIWGTCFATSTLVTHPLPPLASWSGDCSSYGVQDPCKTANCYWCPGCSGTSTNNYGGVDKCVTSTSDCTYSYVAGSCE